MVRAASMLFAVLLLACFAGRAQAQVPVSPGGGNMVATLPPQPSATEQSQSLRYFGSLSFVSARPWFFAVVPQVQRTAVQRPVATGFMAIRERRAVGTR